MADTTQEPRIGVDLMGGDGAPGPNIQGCVLALGQGYRVTAFGDEESTRAIRSKASSPLLETVLCTERISDDESPLRAVRRKSDSSITKGIEAARDGTVQAFVSRGSTGALVAGGAVILGRLPGIDKPCLAAILPSTNPRGVLFLDLGAAADTRPETLVAFAVMGSIYAELALGWPKPKVCLLSNGTESEKGSAITRKAYQLLLRTPISFGGNMEARDVLQGMADVVVADGFSGNIFLKASEGAAEYLLGALKREMTKGPIVRLAASFLRPAIKRAGLSMDYTRYGGAFLLGLSGCIVKCHGSSGPVAVASGVAQARAYAAGQVSDVISRTLSQMVSEGE